MQGNLCIRQIICGLVVLIISIDAPDLFGQSTKGTYAHRIYTPNDYQIEDFGTSPQNFGIAQDNRGILYVCNTSGILEYDGVSWSLVAGTEGLSLLKASKGGDGIIYTCGINEFGFLRKGSGTEIQYESLTHLLPDTISDFGRVFMLQSFGDSMAFLSSQYLFVYHDGSIDLQYAEEGYRRVLKHNDRMFVQLRTGALFEVTREGLAPAHNNDMPDRRIVRMMFGQENSPLLACNRGGLLRLDDDKILAHESDISSLFVWNGCSLDSSTNVLATNANGAYVVDDMGRTQEVFYTNYDLEGTAVIFPFYDANGQMWLATSNGVRYIEYPNKLSYFNDVHNLQGLPLCVNESRRGLMVGTTTGLYVFDGTTGSLKREVIDAAIDAEEWVTDITDFAGEKWILTTHGLFIMKDEAFERITNIGGRDIDTLTDARNALVYGGNNGLVKIEKGDNGWGLTSHIDTIGHDIMDVTYESSTRAWVSMFNISQIEFSGSQVTVTTLDSTHGFSPDMSPIWSFAHDNKVYFGTTLGLYSWDSELERIVPDSTFGARFLEGAISNVTVTKDDDLWLRHDDKIGKLSFDLKEFEFQDLERLEYSDVWGIHPTNSGHIWILTTEAVYRYDPSIDNSNQEGFSTIIRGVTSGEDSVLFSGFYADISGAPSLVQPDSMRPVLDYRNNQMSVRYAATYYTAPDQTRYSTMLAGQDDNWSQWTSQPFRDLMNLREGDYTFKVKARNVYGVESSTASYSFTVLPPWYRTFWAYLGYTIAAILATWGVAVLYSRRLRQQNVRLEGIVADRTREIAEEKEKSDNLLLNILPVETAEELKRQGHATTRSYESVSVLFADFVSFTKIAEAMSPEELVDEINVCFSAFDDIVEKEGVEKIKTIGDAYMCASGLNRDVRDPEVRMVRVARGMLDFIERHNAERREAGLPFFQVRIGVHSGPVVAGVVGKKKFAYDIWGDTVNTASRMESSCDPDHINISATTYHAVKEHFHCESRGMISAKNKGQMEMYYVRKQIRDEESVLS